MTNLLCTAILCFFYWQLFSQWDISFSHASSPKQSTRDDELSQSICTPLRYNTMAVTYCLLMVAIYWLMLSLFKWAVAPGIIEQLELWTLAIQIIVLPRLPLLGEWLSNLRHLIQRHSFEPVFPSLADERILAQLTHFESCLQPCQEQLADLDKSTATTILSKPKGQKAALYANWAKLDFLYRRLLTHNKQKKHFPIVKASMDQELEFLDVHHRLLAVEINTLDAINGDKIRELQKVTDNLMYFIYRLICLKVMTEHYSREARLFAFRDFGLVVNTENAWIYNIYQQSVFALHKYLPLRIEQKWKAYRPQLWERDDRRKSKRIHCYEKTIVSFDDCQLAAASSVVSLNGLAVRGKTDKPLGSKLSMFMEGLGNLNGTLIRKSEDEICVAFQQESHDRNRLARYLDYFSVPVF